MFELKTLNLADSPPILQDKIASAHSRVYLIDMDRQPVKSNHATSSPTSRSIGQKPSKRSIKKIKSDFGLLLPDKYRHPFGC
jgi:hypothetical protein